MELIFFIVTDLMTYNVIVANMCIYDLYFSFFASEKFVFIKFT